MLAASARLIRDPEQLESQLRRMGLRPQRQTMPYPVGASAIVGDCWLVRFGALTARVGPAGPAAARPPIADAGCLLIQPLAADVPDDPVVAAREVLKLAMLLVDLCDAEQFYWSPADLWSDAAHCRLAVAEMLDSGMPPVLHLVAFVDADHGGGIRTRGLSHFCGQELSLWPVDGMDRLAQMRRLVRLALDMTMNGPITAPRRFPGLVAGEVIQIQPRPAVSGMPLVVEVRILPE